MTASKPLHRWVIAIITALAVLFAPALATAATIAGKAAGAQTEASAHCHSSSDKQDKETLAGKSCCVAGCMAMPAELGMQPIDGLTQLTSPSLIIPFDGVSRDIETPPPKQP